MEVSGGERPERRRGREERGERVAAVGKTQACFVRRSGCRVPQQDSNAPLTGESNDLNAARMSAARCVQPQRNLYFAAGKMQIDPGLGATMK